jgi:hypothetical protein
LEEVRKVERVVYMPIIQRKKLKEKELKRPNLSKGLRSLRNSLMSQSSLKII